MKPITIEEIEYASTVLFDGDPNKFYDDIEGKRGERIDVIQNLENIDVNACPGSGKTTALLAKLIILANRMPFEDGRGICVLTHTNVAIDLIKEKLGAKASILFSHPNFFGTIQSFVDRFLATPAIIEKYGVRPDIVDNDRANAKLFNNYFNGRTKLNSRIFITLFAKHSQLTTKDFSELLQIKKSDATEIIKYLKKEQVLESTKSPFNLNYGNSKKSYLDSRISKHPQAIQITQAILGIRNQAIKLSTDSSNQVEQLRKLNLNFILEQVTEYGDNYGGFNTESGKAFLEIKEECFKNGLITFSDAYSFSELYIRKYPEISKAFTERFKYIFVDEMQDTAKHQIEIINALFKKGGESIVQYYGDPNQAIFESEGQKDSGWNPDPKSSTTFILKKSKRFGEPIAKAISPIRVIPDEENLIEGENSESKIKPYLILFDNENNIEKVLDKFGQLILDNQLHKTDNTRFVAIGRVGKEHAKGELSLKSYFPEYEKENSKKKEFYPYFILYMRKDAGNSRQLKQISNCIINGILHTLDLHGFKNEYSKRGTANKIIRRFSKTTFLNFLKYSYGEIYFELKKNMVRWSNQINSDDSPFNTDVKKEVEEFISHKIFPLKEKNIDSSLDFFNIPQEIQETINKSKEETEDTKQPENNVYDFVFQENEIEYQLPIKLNTIHGEKGKTHTATLYLETYFKKFHDSQRIKEQLFGNPFEPKGAEINMAAKMAYVAMSRSKYLLCFAVQKSAIQDILDEPIKKEKLESIWVLKDV